MKHLQKAPPESEQTEFYEKFHDKNKSYRIVCDMRGNIWSIDTNDTEILEHASKLGLK
jgi:uncharacterized protein YbcV (DUF1398 family)